MAGKTKSEEEVPIFIPGWGPFHNWVYNSLGLKISRRKLEAYGPEFKRLGIVITLRIGFGKSRRRVLYFDTTRFHAWLTAKGSNGEII